MVGLTVTTKPAPPDSFLVACEEWRPVVGFETHYAVSSLGRIMRVAGGKAARPGRILKPTPNAGGYPTVWLSVNGIHHARMVHLLTAQAFIGPPYGREVNHKDANKLNPAMTNLEYATRRENADHAMAFGLYNKGTQCYNAVVTPLEVRGVRAAYAKGETQKNIAAHYGIGKHIVQSIVTGKAWAWLH